MKFLAIVPALMRCFLLGTILSSVLACNRGPATPEHTEAEATQQTVTRYRVAVNNLSLRDRPSQTGSQVVELLKEGEEVSYLGKTSEHRDEIELRGTTYREPWYYVMTASGHEGWLFGGGMTIETVSVGNRATESVDPVKVKEFSQALDQLPKNKPESGGKALALFQEMFSSANPASADAAYVRLDRFFTDAVDDLNATFHRDAKLTRKELDLFLDELSEALEPVMNRTPYTQRLGNNGFSLETSEGDLYVTRDAPQIWKTVKPLVSETMNTFLSIETPCYRRRFQDDMALLIGPVELAQRAMDWDAFVQKYKGFVLWESANWEKWMYREVLLNGLDNTPAYEYSGTPRRSLDPYFKQAYEKIMAESPRSELGGVISELHGMLTRNGFVYDDQVEKFIQKSLKGRPSR
jgi:hypothetical protein